MSKKSQGFIDGYNDHSYDYVICNKVQNYHEDFHDGLLKRKIHILILGSENVFYEDFENNNIVAVSILSNWR